ncbi:hypothetical protein D0T50_02725 [Bacteroides sp. 214]|uniref:hypothetical protein n=1 Tax=Bacteroides sp. 214 TaxID=2302935 RepID=UPI0013CF6FD9|nr:hypothetical protein [Bacteroides sp. 214]NDW11802.1 hypothetical protein [Bacteroides sp. 214]
MKAITIFTLLFLAVSGNCLAQNDYLVKTAKTGSAATSTEERLVEDNFPYYSICEWTPGMKFMFIVDERSSFISILKSPANDRDVDNSKFQHKILEFKGYETVEKEGYTGKSISTRFLFECEGEPFYHEVKNQSPAEICANNQRAFIGSLAYLGDVDTAREFFVGKTLRTVSTNFFVDDHSSQNGFKTATVARNEEVKVTAIGVGSREYPVKIIFEDKNGNSYFTQLAFSKTNSGLLASDFTGERHNRAFQNVFSFEDKDMKAQGNLKSKYVGKAAYPNNEITATKDGSTVKLARYTPLTITSMDMKSGTKALLKLKDREGNIYEREVDTKYDIFVRNEDFIDDMFGFGDLRAQYPSITEENWALLSKGQIKVGMTQDECRLSLGEPIRTEKNTNARYETWYYQGKMLSFEGKTLQRIR